MPDGPLLEIAAISLRLEVGDLTVVKATSDSWHGLDAADVALNGDTIADWPDDLRLRAGLFTTTGRPAPVPGIATIDLVHAMVNSGSVMERQALAATWCDRLQLDHELLQRPLDAGFTPVESVGVELLHLAMLRPAVAVLDLVATPHPSGPGVNHSIVHGIRQLRSNQPDIAVVVVTNDDELIAALGPDHVTTCAGTDVGRTHRDEALL